MPHPCAGRPRLTRAGADCDDVRDVRYGNDTKRTRCRRPRGDERCRHCASISAAPRSSSACSTARASLASDRPARTLGSEADLDTGRATRARRADSADGAAPSRPSASPSPAWSTARTAASSPPTASTATLHGRDLRAWAADGIRRAPASSRTTRARPSSARATYGAAAGRTRRRAHHARHRHRHRRDHRRTAPARRPRPRGDPRRTHHRRPRRAALQLRQRRMRRGGREHLGPPARCRVRIPHLGRIGPRRTCRTRGRIGLRDLVETRDDTRVAATLRPLPARLGRRDRHALPRLRPDVVVVSGGVMRSADVILPPLAELRARAPVVVVAPPRLRHSRRSRTLGPARPLGTRRALGERAAIRPKGRSVTLADHHMLDDDLRQAALGRAAAGQRRLVRRRGVERARRGRSRCRRRPRRPSSRSTRIPASTCRPSIAELREALPGYDVIDVEERRGQPIERDRRADRSQPDRRPRLRCHGSLHRSTSSTTPSELAALAAPVAGTARPDRSSSAGAPPSSPVTPDVLVLADLARWEIQQRQRRGRDELAHRQRRRGQPPQVQARLLRRMARRRPPQARRSSTGSTSCSTRTRASATPGCITRRRPSARALANATSGAAARRAVLRPRRLGRPVDEGPPRPRSARRQLRLVLRLRARRELAAARGRWPRRRDPRDGPRAQPAARAARREDVRAFRRRVPHPLRLPRHDGRRQPLAAGASAHRLHPATRSACTTRRTRATTCSTPTRTRSSTSASRRASTRPR